MSFTATTTSFTDKLQQVNYHILLKGMWWQLFFLIFFLTCIEYSLNMTQTMVK